MTTKQNKVSEKKSDPRVTVSKGTEIGYRPAFTSGNRKPVSLAKVGDGDIDLSSGYHLLLARNGRGKTTFLKTVAGCYKALNGKIEVEGNVQYISEDLKFDPELTPKTIFRSLFDKKLCELALSISERLELSVKTPYGKLSKGNRQKLAIIIAETRASEGGPQILLLDEPFSGIDFHVREEIGKIWSECEKNHLRIICIHPDEQTLEADGVLTINDGALAWEPVETHLNWGELKPHLN